MSNEVTPLEPPEAMSLNAALGWLGLGNAQEAVKELDGIASATQLHPAVLLVRYEVYSTAHDWDRASSVARTLTEQMPANAFGWIGLAYSTRRKTDGGIPQAKEILLAARPRFPGEYLFPYNLACYCSQLREFGQALIWLNEAYAMERDAVKKLAREDDDLKPLWETLGGKLWPDE
jgi:predicted Zn-dependent protease